MNSEQKNSRVNLRPPRSVDADKVWVWRHQPELNLHQPLVELSSAQLKEDLLRYAYRPNDRFLKDRFHWIIERTRDQIPMGWITLTIRNRLHQIGEIGYSLSAEFHGQGYGTEAVCRFLMLAFCELELYRIEAKCSVYNPASYKLLEKCGFQREGILRQYLMIRNTRVDHYLYAILKSDWFQR